MQRNSWTPTTLPTVSSQSQNQTTDSYFIPSESLDYSVDQDEPFINPNVIQQQSVPSTPSMLRSSSSTVSTFEGLLKGEGPEFQYFGTGPNCCLELFVWIISKLTFGFVEAFFAMSLKKTEVESMVIAGRRLNFDTHDPWLKVPILCIINNFINSSTFGIWYLSGLMHVFYYSEFDNRITWGEVVDGKKHKVVWQPNDSGKGQFHIFGAFPGIYCEVSTWIFRFLSAMFLLGLAEPWIKSRYYHELLPKMEFGGLGQFIVTNVPTPTSHHGREKLKVYFSARGHQIFFRWLQGHILVVLTLGIFMCCFGGWIDSFMNKYIKVNENHAPSLASFRQVEMEPTNYYVGQSHSLDSINSV